MRCKKCFEEYNDEYKVCPHCGYYEGQPEKVSFSLQSGSIVRSRYVIGEVVGTGGFGITYKAWDTKLDTIVAIKESFPMGFVQRVPGTKEVVLVSKKRMVEYKHIYKRFLDEAKSMAKFSGKSNIVNVFEYFEENNTAYIVMEYLDGVDLKEELANAGGKLSVERSISIISEVCTAIRQMHNENILHRDIAPDNIRLCRNDKVRLLDFGAARLVDGEDVELVLKPGYAPPEQYEKINKQGPWTDIYALGATMYLMVTGVKPEESTNRKVVDNLPDAKTVNPDVPENISNAIAKAMAVEQHMRFASVDEFKKAIQGEKKVVSLRKERKRRKARRFAGIFAALLVLCIGYGIFTVRLEKQREEETLPKAELDLWYIVEDTANEADEKQKAISAIVSEFTRSYDTVTIHATPVNVAEYGNKLNAAVTSGENLPEIFESTGLPDEALSKAIDVTDAYDNVKGTLCFEKNVKKYCKDTKKLSTTFQIPLVYVNSIRYKGDTSNLNAVLQGLHVTDVAAQTDLNAFLSGAADLYCGSSQFYEAVQKALPAQYKMFPLASDVSYSYATTWSANECDGNQKKVVAKFFEYLYSDNAQDMMCIQNNTKVLPLNKGVLSVYQQVYTEFKGYFDNIEDYSIK